MSILGTANSTVLANPAAPSLAAKTAPRVQQLSRPWLKSRATANTCRHCGRSTGVRGIFGSRFCSKAHEEAEKAAIQRKMAARLEESAARIRRYMEGKVSPESR